MAVTSYTAGFVELPLGAHLPGEESRVPQPSGVDPSPASLADALVPPADLVTGGVQRIVLVEDDDGDALLVESLIDETFLGSCDIVRARTLAEAKALLANQPASLSWCALVDLGLPDAHGLEALEVLRRVAPNDPLVVMTGRADDALGLQAVAVGAQDYLVKGQVEPSNLRRSIGYALERCRADEASRLLLEQGLLQEENARLERGLLPSPLLDRHADIRWSARYQPGSDRLRIGGDYYDLVERDGELHLLVGDVCGHGPDEAALGVVLRVAWRALIRAGLSPDLVVRQLDDLMLAEAIMPAQFTTMASIRLTSPTEIGVTLAGHPPPLVVTGHDVEMLDVKPGPPLGVVAGATWHEAVVPVAPGSTLLAYTDGLFEGRAAPRSPDRLGIEAVAEVVASLRRAGHEHESLLELLMAEVTRRNGGPIDDDIAVVQVELDTLRPRDDP
jgi:serine phosphatase RsbU (regulator of sigma subunit)